MDAIEFFVLHHERLHMQVARDFLQGLSDEQMRLRPHGLNSIAWLVWHTARCEDALNLLLVGRPQVLDEADWLPRLNLSIRDVGTEMGDDEASDLSARINLTALRDYYTAVGPNIAKLKNLARLTLSGGLNSAETYTQSSLLLFDCVVHSHSIACSLRLTPARRS